MSEKKLNSEMEAAALTEAELNDAAGGLSLGSVKNFTKKAANAVVDTAVDATKETVRIVAENKGAAVAIGTGAGTLTGAAVGATIGAVGGAAVIPSAALGATIGGAAGGLAAGTIVVAADIVDDAIN